MSTEEIAKGLIELCSKGKFEDAVNKYYAQDIVSVEPVAMPPMPAESKGIDAIRGKNQWFEENHDVHTIKIEGPFLGQNQFAVKFHLDMTPKHTGQRVSMSEMALYTVKDGKIAREEFYYNAGK